MVIVGCTNAQSIPKYDPKYLDLKSFLVSSKISLPLLNMSIKNAKNYLKYLISI